MAGVLDGQVALVTGGSSGIGYASVEALARAGAAVAVNYFGSPDAAKTLASKLQAAGGRAMAVQADVSKEDEVEHMFASVAETLGVPDIVVANAGMQLDAPLRSMTLAQWQRVLDVNLTGQFLCARAGARAMLARGPRPDISRATGKIICMSSVHQVIPWAGHVNYATSKGGVMLMMKTLAQELAPQGIRVNGIAPGAIRTGINRPAWEKPEALNRLLKLVPYGRIGEPEDIGRAVVWLASDDSDYVVGATLFVDGGMTLYPAFADNG